MEKHNIIVIGASAGGIEALRDLFVRLRPSQETTIFIVVHIPAHVKSRLPEILSRAGPMLVEHAVNGVPIQPGRAYIAPPNQHLLLQEDVMRLEFGPKENGFRPAVDPLFRSAAQVFGERVTGVILSGNLYDGTRGLMAIKRAGGVTLVQDPEEALYPGMPTSAISLAVVDHVLPISKIAELLNSLSDIRLTHQGEKQMDAELHEYSSDEVGLIRNEIKEYEQGNSKNHRAVFSCPDCGGVLWELEDDKVLRYRCHIGHAYNPETLLAKQDEGLEIAFWSAVRVLVEKASLANRLAVRAEKNGNPELEDYYLQQARTAEKEAELIRSTWFQGKAVNALGLSAGEQANREITQDNG